MWQRDLKKFVNLIDIIEDCRGLNKGITFINSIDTEEYISYRELYDKALTILYAFQARGLKPGIELIFQVDDNTDFVPVFWACILGKIVPVPVTVGNNDEYLLKLFNIWRVLKSPHLITFQKHFTRLEKFAREKELTDLFKQIETQTIILENLHQEVKKEQGKGTIVRPDETDTAFIQFSSGSTGSPKGVILTHKNLVTNMKAFVKGLKSREEDKGFSWMPLTHDMGIVGFHIGSFAAGWNQCLMATPLFVRYPALWLQKVSDTGSTITCSPNFGYKYVLKYFDPLKYKDLDLSCLRIIFNGAEPISAELADEFLDSMAAYGLKRTVMFPVYGLAEASLAVTFPEPESEMEIACFDRSTLGLGERAKEVKTVNGESDETDVISLVAVGSPVENCSLKIIDNSGNQCEDDVIGHVLIKGDNVTSGYYSNPEATKKAFTANGWFRTGDLGFLRNGSLFITGREKEILFSTGMNYYPHDLERVAEELEGIEFEKVAAASVYNREIQSDEVIFFVVFKRKLDDFMPLIASLKEHIAAKTGLLVHKVIPVKRIPKTTSGKIRRFKLKNQYLAGEYDPVVNKITDLQNEIIAARKNLSKTELKEITVKIWQEVLGLDNIGEDDNFFDLGGNSSFALQIQGKLHKEIGRDIDEVAMFKYPTVNTLCDYLSSGKSDVTLAMEQKERLEIFKESRTRVREKIRQQFINKPGENKNIGRTGWEIAVIGMSCRFPGANHIHEFWENLKNGKESICFFSEEELLESGVPPWLPGNPNYVKAKGVIEDIDCFDAGFFGYPSLEAKKMDPQVRIFHECSWGALEDAGYDPGAYNGLIGVFVGASPNPYWESIFLSPAASSLDAVQQFIDVPIIEKDFMTTRLSYKLKLTGPSFNMYTACSTSLVSIDLACQGLLLGKCDMALAGGVSICLPRKNGYLHEEGMIFSRDGHNRTFDEQASGTVFSDGAGIVVLKRLDEALADKDHIYAVIKGSAINNDGHRKIGYTAPATEGQAEVIISALDMAGVEPESIRFVEAHGTATHLGDPIEIDALHAAFGTGKKGFCAIGSVKSNIGHVNAAAGVAGFIKAVLCLTHRQFPPALYFRQANPRIDFENSPFYVNTQLIDWKQGDYPLRAGVSSFGIGGTNAHAILEEAPLDGEPVKLKSVTGGESQDAISCLDSRQYQLFVLSARTPAALERMKENLAAYLKKNPSVNLADAAYTLQRGRVAFEYRGMCMGTTTDEIAAVLSAGPQESETLKTARAKAEESPVVFMFSGQGSQYVDMGLGIYREEPVFRKEMDRCFSILTPLTGYDIKEILYPGASIDEGREPGEVSVTGTGTEPERINRTEIAQPLLFAFEYALAKLLISWGIKPAALVGHSIGEYVAACLSGVFSPEDALAIVVTRGKLMQKVPAGAMVGVPLPEKELIPLLNDELSLAAVNGPGHCVVSGTFTAVDTFSEKLAKQGLETRRIHTSHAFHSAMMDPVLKEFSLAVKKVTLNPPKIPFISNVSGTWITRREVTTPAYWSGHVRRTVRFSDGVEQLIKEKNSLFIEVGPGNTLQTLAKKIAKNNPEVMTLNLVRHPREETADNRYLLDKLGRLWLYGQAVDWDGYHGDRGRRRISLPTYSFEPRRFRTMTLPKEAGSVTGSLVLPKNPDPGKWFYEPIWKPIDLPAPSEQETLEKTKEWLLLTDECGLGSEILRKLQKEEESVTLVRAGSEFQRLGDREYCIDPGNSEHYETLFQHLQALNILPRRILHLWCVTGPPPGDTTQKRVEALQARGFDSLISLVQVLRKQAPNVKFQVKVVSDNMQKLGEEEYLEPGKATLLGPVKVISKECPNIRCWSIDVVLTPDDNRAGQQLAEQILAESGNLDHEKVIAYRSHQRYVQTFAPVSMGKPGKEKPVLREKGVYLITGGLGGIGLILAQHLATSVQAKLILIGRSSLPERSQWQNWLSEHGDDDPVSVKIRKIQELESLGSEVLALSADAANMEQMSQVINRAEQDFGPLNGVIHAAGVLDGTKIIRRTLQESRDIMAVKLFGTLILGQILQEKELDFFLLCSSIASILPPPGWVAYAAANAFLDAFAASSHLAGNDKRTPVISAGWDRWQDIGIALKAGEKQKGLLDDELENGITAGEGIDVFTRLLANPLPWLVISTTDLKQRIERYNYFEVSYYKDRAGREQDGQPTPTRQQPGQDAVYAEPTNEIEEKLAAILSEFLDIDHIGIHDNFFELGATSLDLIRINRKINEVFETDLPVVKLLTHTTIHSFAAYFATEVLGYESSGKDIPGPSTLDIRKQLSQQRIAAAQTQPGAAGIEVREPGSTGREIAVIGMSGRFPGADNLRELWENLENGVESIFFFSEQELEESGIDPELIAAPGYVKAKGVLHEPGYFDALFFDYHPREAETMDPQTRIFHECTWEALEHAGYDPFSYPGLIGLYAGASPHPYWDAATSVLGMKTSSEMFSSIHLSDKDFFATRIAYKLNLKGTTFVVATACSTSLLAVHLANECLLRGECDMVLAGGISVGLPEKVGYLYEEGMILSSDGHNRTFADKASGSIFSDGVGVVLLKRLADALADNDTIHAVIKGSAANNDGNRKLGYTAPSVEGQGQVVKIALEMAEVEPASISYFEAHGTATALGDNVEMEALNQVFQGVEKKNFCAIGSIKSNLGHLNAAAGIAGFIKAVLTLKYRLIPPGLHFEQPNPRIDFENSPFYVNTQLIKWETNNFPRRAGVSSFGIGGTNAHVVLEEAPQYLPTPGTPGETRREREYRLILLSAKTANALEQAATNFGEYLKEHPRINLSDAAYTLQVGRKYFQHREMLVCTGVDEAISILSSPVSEHRHGFSTPEEGRYVVFMFPGQGAQYVNMGRELYEKEPLFRRELDRCFEIVKSLTEHDLKAILYPGDSTIPVPGKNKTRPIDQTEITQPLLFIFEYALARLFMSWGIKPRAMTGHSIGEYVAAHFAGVFSLEDALKLVVLRGKLMQGVPAGAMLSVPLAEAELQPLLKAHPLHDDIALAAVNSSSLCVVSGTFEAIASFQQTLNQQGHKSTRLHTSHAYHSRMMEPILEEFAGKVKEIRLNKPVTQYISNVSGTWITAEQAVNPEYWARHLRETVRFSDGLQEFLKKKNTIFLEIGPGRTLSTFVKKHIDKQPEHMTLNTVRHPGENVADTRYLLNKVGQYWLYGGEIDWKNFHENEGEKRRRIPLPTYPFEHKHFGKWESGLMDLVRPGLAIEEALQKKEIRDWFYIPSWVRTRTVFPASAAEINMGDVSAPWLFFMDTCGIGSKLAEHLEAMGVEIISVKAGEAFAKITGHHNDYSINPAQDNDYHTLFQELRSTGKIPGMIVHLWGVTADTGDLLRAEGPDSSHIDHTLDLGFYSLLHLARAIGHQEIDEQIRIEVVTNNMQKVDAEDSVSPLKAAVLGPCKIIPREYPNLSCRSIDILLPEQGAEENHELILRLLVELTDQSPDMDTDTTMDTTLAYRNNLRWSERFEPVPLRAVQPVPRFKEGGVYLVTGGLGGIGLILAEYLARNYKARLILTGRTALPEKTEWEQWLGSHEEDDPVSTRIKAVQALEMAGGEILVPCADVIDQHQVQQVVTEAEGRFGRINGVIHAAGLADGTLIHMRTRQVSEQVLAPKIKGTVVLHNVFKDRPLDFFILFSSLSVIMAPMGQVAYCAANAFLDAFALYKSGSDNGFTVSIDWDAWQDTGMAGKSSKQMPQFLERFFSTGMSGPEGIDALERIMAESFPRVAVSTTDLRTRIRQLDSLHLLSIVDDESIGISARSTTTHQRPGLDIPYVEPTNEIEEKLADLLQGYFGIDHIGIHDNFFDLGATSLDLLQVNHRINEQFNVKIPLVKLMTFTTIHSFAEYFAGELSGKGNRTAQKEIREHRTLKIRKQILKQRFAAVEKQRTAPVPGKIVQEKAGVNGREIAVIGMSGRFPGANSIAEFWENLQQGVEAIYFFSEEEVAGSGIDAQLIQNPDYIRARGMLEDTGHFDALFFDYHPGEAETMDPQSRIFHECCWEALEQAGYDPFAYPGLIGLYAGAAPHPFWDSVTSVLKMKKSSEIFSSICLSNKDFFATRIAYKLNLKGTAFAMATACSTSLLAVPLACDSLLSGACDMALAGGISVGLPEKMGYFYEDGMILSSDGHNRTFDEKASGSIFSDGAGVVLLKRLSDALADRDTIHAVIKGFATNNDGNRKLGYAAPSVDGQAQVIRTALEMAEVDPGTVSYLEAHGTATALGDNVEMEAINQVFQHYQVKKTHVCAVGSVKSNVGHLNIAAGIAGFLKTVLALKHGCIPPSLHYETPNPRIDFANSPFYVNHQLMEWKTNGYPRRAGVSSFGIGGTNAHVLLEEPPQITPSPETRQWKPLLLSARSEASLEKAGENLVTFFKGNPGVNISDAAYTLQVGRKHFQYRKMLVCQDVDDARVVLSSPGSDRLFTVYAPEENPAAVFLFPGQGSQYVNMGRDLYEKEPLFREEMDRCFEMLKPLMEMEVDVKDILFPAEPGIEADEAGKINRTEIAQPVLFIFEYALARVLVKWGINPVALMGHSIGEYVAACLSGVFSLQDALALVVLRGKSMQELPAGAMLSVPLPEQELMPLLEDGLSLAAVNGPGHCVVSGPFEIIDTFSEKLEKQGTQTRRIHTSHAFHSPMMEPILEPFAEAVKKVPLNPPLIPFISNVSGTWITEEETIDPVYWANHLRNTVRFFDGVEALIKKNKHSLFIEVGPGNVLQTLVKKITAGNPDIKTLNLVRHSREEVADDRYLAERLGRLWLYGQDIDWPAYHGNDMRYRIPLPTYRFDRQPFDRFSAHGLPLMLPGEQGIFPGNIALPKKADIKDWFYVPAWKSADCPGPAPEPGSGPGEWLLFMDDCGLGSKILAQLQQEGEAVTVVRPASDFSRLNDREYCLNPAHEDDFQTLFTHLGELSILPTRILHLWCVTGNVNPGIPIGKINFATEEPVQSSSQQQEWQEWQAWLEDIQGRAFYSLLSLARALGDLAAEADTEFQIKVVSDNVHRLQHLPDVAGEIYLCPEKAILLGPVRVISQEYPNINCSSIDIELEEPGDGLSGEWVDRVLQEFGAGAKEKVVAYRGQQRRVQGFEPAPAAGTGNQGTKLRENGVYLITGGLGGIGLILAEHLASSVKAKLILTGRTALPGKESWPEWLSTHQEDDPTSRKIRKVRELETLGADVLLLEADVADVVQMKQAIHTAVRRFGSINGVIHAAGVADGALIPMRTPEMSRDILAPKLTGTLILKEILKNQELDFFHVCSSVASVLSLPGQVAYAAANAFLDAFADKEAAANPDRVNVTSIAWDRWQDVGIALLAGETYKELLGHEAHNGIEPGEGIEVFTRLLENPAPRVLISTSDLNKRIETYNYYETSAGMNLYPPGALVRPKPLHQRPGLDVDYVEPTTEIEKKLADILQEYFGIDHIGIYDNFFDLGANSLDLLQVNRKINEEFDVKIPVVKLMTYTTIHAFAEYFAGEISGTGAAEKEMRESQALEKRKEMLTQRFTPAGKQDTAPLAGKIPQPGVETTGREIAVIGMAGRFPGANTIDEFWENLHNGVETIFFFSEQELEETGIDPQLITNPDYVKARGVLEDTGCFDALFFDYHPREAEIMDPQARIFHECAWEALEHAGYDPYAYPGLIGLYAGAAPHPYWDLATSVLEMKKSSEILSSILLSDKDFFTTRIAYKLNLKGTAFALATACSTALLAVPLACDCLLSGGCDMALAGGISVGLPEKIGYFYEEGMILSVDGHNRTFDEKASGSIFSDGAGVVLLKRLDEALADRDFIYAVIKGAATNNDGNRKLGYTAPSVEGQAHVIRTALAMAEVEPESIGYLEAHGTATSLGDNVEMEALNLVFQKVTKRNYCAVGSVKSNVGHLNIAAGIAGFIKTVLALKHRHIPPSLHFEQPNPRVDFDNSPFYVNNRLVEWKTNGDPRRAGVSSFGIGGTNVHVVLEEAPEVKSAPPDREWKMLMLSARSEASLEKAGEKLVRFLRKNPQVNLSDAAYTLQLGRRHFQHRKMLLARDVEEALAMLTAPEADQIYSFYAPEETRSVVFLFSGLGSQYVNMGKELYEKIPLFRQQMDRCFNILAPLLDVDIKEIIYPAGESEINEMNQAHIAQVLLFVFEYALARMMIQYGIIPRAMIGYSFGEYAAACIAGVFSLEDALGLVVTRGKLIRELPPGAMLSIPLPVEKVKPLLEDFPGNELSLSIDNGTTCVIGGPVDTVKAFEQHMKSQRVICIPINARHAIHSKMMEPILDQFRETVSKISLNKPRIPYISNVSGTWITDEDAVDNRYWCRHLRETVRFSAGMAELLKEEDSIFVEIGPGRALCTQLRQEAGKDSQRLMLNLLKHPEESFSDVYYLFNKIGHLWLWGVKPNWQEFYRSDNGGKRYRIPLPTYAFANEEFLKAASIGLAKASGASASLAGKLMPETPTRLSSVSRWFYRPSWQPRWLAEQEQEIGETGETNQQKKSLCLLVLLDQLGLGIQLADRLQTAGHHVIPVKIGTDFSKTGNPDKTSYTLDPTQPEHFHALFKELHQAQEIPDRIFHLWGVTGTAPGFPNVDRIDGFLDRGFYSLLYIARAIEKLHVFKDIRMAVITDNMQDVGDEQGLCPEKAVVPAACKVIAQEYAAIYCRSIDVALPRKGIKPGDRLVKNLVKELLSKSSDLVVAYRGNYRWVQVYEPIILPNTGNGTPGITLKKEGVYLITGGLGGIGYELARYLAREVNARLVLTGRTDLPAEDQWQEILSASTNEDGVNKKIKKLQELQAMGAEVLAVKADAADESQMAAAIARAEERFGAINGVIHTAGLMGQEAVRPIGDIDKEYCRNYFRPKIYGILVLEKLLREKSLDFCFLMSSIAAVLGGLGLSAYAAGNSFMDAFTRLKNLENHGHWISVNWDGWRSGAEHQAGNFSMASWEEFAMSPEEAIEAFRRVLTLEEPGHIVNSTGPLQARLDQWVNKELSQANKHLARRKDSSASSSRRRLPNAYITPRNELEQTLANVWQEYLGIDRVGADDNFFDLNATSLDIVRVNSLLREALKRDIPVVAMFNHPNIAALSKFLSQDSGDEDATAQKVKREESINKAQTRMQQLRDRNVRSKK